MIKKYITAAVLAAALIVSSGCSVSELDSFIGELEMYNGGSGNTGETVSGEMTVRFLDVGQADCIYITLPNGKDMLIDAGKNSTADEVCSELMGYGADKIDYVIGTHPHEDHIGGLDTVIDTFDIGSVYMPRVQTDTQTFLSVLESVQNKGLTVQTAQSGVEILNEPGLSISMLAPVSAEYSELNDYSAVIRLVYGDTAFLFTGDAETLSENEITADVSADVLKVGHHGSDTSSSAEFLSRVSPQYAVIMVGEGNSYGHPSQDVLSRLESMGTKIYRTDENGTVTAVSDGTDITISPERQ